MTEAAAAGRVVGFAVERPLRAWEARAVEATARTPGVAAVAVFALPPRPRRSAGDRALAAYARLDRALLGAAHDALAPVGRDPRETIEVDSVDELLARATASGLDVLVDLTDLALDPSQLPSGSSTEIWALRHGDVSCGAPHALFHELAAGEQTCVSTLLRRGPEGAEVLYRTHSFVRRLSLQRARSPIFWKGAALVPRALRREAAAIEPAAPTADRPPPSAGEVAVLQRRLARRSLAFAREHVAQRPTWSIAWRAAERRAESSAEVVPDGRLDPPDGRFYADPFVVGHEGRHYLFYEDYRSSLGRAELAVGELVDGRLGPATTILSRPYHLSYPFVFRRGDDHFLVPESAGSGLVQLYRAVDFPTAWNLDSTLLEEVQAYDSTLVEHDGWWFLLAAIPEQGADIDELHVFWADDLRGPYRPHPLNPVVSDVARARPAGRIFTQGGRLIRPGQDGSRGYGSAIALSEIVRLSPDEYEERLVGRIEPDWDAGALGTHTIDHDDGIEVVDVKLSRPRLGLAAGQRRAALRARWRVASAASAAAPRTLGG